MPSRLRRGLFFRGGAWYNRKYFQDSFPVTNTLRLITNKKSSNFGCVRLGNPDLDFQNPDFGFPIEREIRKRISTLRYLFLDFHFYRSIGKSAKGFEKLFLRTAVLHAHA